MGGEGYHKIENYTPPSHLTDLNETSQSSLFKL